MLIWCFLKQRLKCFFSVIKYCQLELPYLYLLTATNNKEFTGKILLTLFCAESSEKNILGCRCTIFHELKSVVKAKITLNNSQVSELLEELQSNQVKIPLMN